MYGIGNYAYIVDDSMPAGSNILIEILKKTLFYLDANYSLTESAFYLQADKGGENKNKTICMF